jgi:hypothetical protein
LRAVRYLVLGLFALTSVKADQLANDAKWIVAGIAVAGAAVGVGITYLVLHERGVVVGCIAESGGKRTLVGSDKKVYSLLDTGASAPVGERAKLKGHKSGPASAPSFQVDKVLEDYGPCHP